MLVSLLFSWACQSQANEDDFSLRDDNPPISRRSSLSARDHWVVAVVEWRHGQDSAIWRPTRHKEKEGDSGEWERERESETGKE